LIAPCVADGEEAFCEVDEAGDSEQYGRVLVAGSSTTLVAGTEHLSLDGQVLADAGSLISLDGITFRAEG
jgi:hypothetical protein